MIIFIRYVFLGFISLSGLRATYGVAMCSSRTAYATTSQQYIDSPNYPSDYNNNLNCQLTIYSTFSSVNIRISSFDLETNHDTLQITSGSTRSTWTGSLGWGYFRGDLYNSVSLRLITDSTATKRGFRLVFFITTGSSSTCSGSDIELTATTAPQFFYSPNYPSNYPDSTRCAWKITSADDDYLVAARPVSFSTEPNHDTLSIYSGYYENKDYIEEWSGSLLPSYNWTARCHAMHLVFDSDFSNNRQGFLIAYWATPRRSYNTYNSEDCSTSTSDSKGVIIGAAVGGVVGFVLLIVLVVCCCKACSNGSSTNTPVRSVAAHTTGPSRSNAVAPAAYPQQPAAPRHAPNGARMYY